MNMKRQIILPLALTVAMGSLGTSPLPALAVTDITSCSTITEPGSYRVTRNLTASGDCLVIDASFVSIDLGGHVLTGNGTNGIGIRLNSSGFGPGPKRSGSEVRNGTITNFGRGISTLQSDSLIERVKVLKNSSEGIGVSGGAKGVVIRQSSASENGDGIIAGTENVLQQNVARKNERYGIGFISCPNLLINNIATENGTLNFFFSNAINVPSPACVKSGNFAP